MDTNSLQVFQGVNNAARLGVRAKPKQYRRIPTLSTRSKMQARDANPIWSIRPVFLILLPFAPVVAWKLYGKLPFAVHVEAHSLTRRTQGEQ